MDSFSINTLTTVMVLAVIIITYAYFRKKRSNRRHLSVLQDFAGASGCNISTYDHWDRNLIGIGKGDRDMLFFIRTANGQEYREAVPLQDIKDCRLVKEEKTLQYNGEKVNMVEKISLAITFRKDSSPALNLEFYNNEYDHLTLSVELQLAQKWLGLVKDSIANGKDPLLHLHREIKGGGPAAGKIQSGGRGKVKQASPAA